MEDEQSEQVRITQVLHEFQQCCSGVTLFLSDTMTLTLSHHNRYSLTQVDGLRGVNRLSEAKSRENTAIAHAEISGFQRKLSHNHKEFTTLASSNSHLKGNNTFTFM
jgi:hypothetical protein